MVDLVARLSVIRGKVNSHDNRKYLNMQDVATIDDAIKEIEYLRKMEALLENRIKEIRFDQEEAEEKK